jgi:hypothetical protein
MKKINFLWAKLILMAAVLLCVFTACDIRAVAAVQCEDTYEVSFYKGGNYLNGNDYLFEVVLDARGDQIINLKSNNKHLKVYQVKYDGFYTKPEIGIGVWTDKKGRFTFEFDVVSAAGNVKEHKVITVISKRAKTAEEHEPCKKIMYCKKDLLSDNFYSLLRVPKKGKLKIKMKKGYKLLEVWYGERSEKDSNLIEWRQIKNNTVITLSDRNYNMHSGYGGSYGRDFDRMEADTFIWVKAQNKKTKETLTKYYTISKLVKYIK